jgi:hypothetical protein
VGGGRGRDRTADLPLFREIVGPTAYASTVADDLPDGLIWWSTPRATVGLIVRGGVIVETAPYARRWAHGRSARDTYQRGLRQKGVTVVWVPIASGPGVPLGD